jgi:hypothetical protein
VSDSGDQRPQDMQDVRLTLAPPPPVRSLAISAVAAVIAAAMMVAHGAFELPAAVMVAGIVVMILAVILAVVALVLTVHFRTLLILDTESITVVKGRHRRTVAWSMIDSVTMRRGRLLLITKPEGGPNITVVNPRASTDATFSALISQIQQRLDADRGYRRIA